MGRLRGEARVMLGLAWVLQAVLLAALLAVLLAGPGCSRGDAGAPPATPQGAETAPEGKASPAAQAAPVPEASATPQAPPPPPPAGQTLERQGIRLGFSLTPTGGGAEVTAGSDSTATFSLTDARTGEPVGGQRPFAWMVLREEGAAAPDEARCKQLVRESMGGTLARMADVNMNAYLLVTMNHDNTLSVINPQIAFERTKLQTLITLSGAPEDWVLHPDGAHLFLTIPGANRVAAVDTLRFKASGSVQVGQRPTRIALSPDGRTLVSGNDGDGTLSVLDPEGREVRQTLKVGPGHHELAFAEGGRTLWVTSSEGDEVHVVDVAGLTVAARIPVGRGATSLVVSPTAGAAYVTQPERGELVVLDVAGRKVARRLTLEKGVHRVSVDPSGRWLFVLNRTRGTATILDGANGQRRHQLKGLAAPDAVSFTDRFAYVRSTGQTHIHLVELASLAVAGQPKVLQVPIMQEPAEKGRGVGIASPIVPTVEGGAVLIASPADKALYLYMEGMMAPSGTHPNYGREPRAVLVVSRSLEEVRPGVYSTLVRPAEGGVYDVPVLLDSPRMALCFEQKVAPGPGVLTQREHPVVLTPLFDPKQLLPAAQEAELRFRVTDAVSREPVPADKVLVVLRRNGGNWHTDARARAVGEGTLAVTFTPPAPGQYQLLVGTRAPKSPLGKVPPVLFGVEDLANRAAPRAPKRGAAR